MIEKLKELEGKRFFYKGMDIIINNTKKVSTTFVVITNKRTFNFFESEVQDFLDLLIEYEEKPKTRVTIKPEAIMEKEVVKTEHTNITNTLYETLEKVKGDKSYIPQANAICNVVSQMINIKKLELQIQGKKNS